MVEDRHTDTMELLIIKIVECSLSNGAMTLLDLENYFSYVKYSLTNIS